MKLTLALLLGLIGLAHEAKALNGYETVCQVRVDREIADVYIQEAGVFRRKGSDGNWTTLFGMKIWDVNKSCFILDAAANLSMTVTSSAGGHGTAVIGYDPRSHLKGSWVYRRFDDFYLKDCGGGIKYKFTSFCH